MANIAKSGTPSLSSVNPGQEHQITGLTAAVDLAAGDACYITAAGAVDKATGSAADAKARVRGFVAIDAQAGEAVTLYRGVRFRYGSGLTPGADVYLSATAGAIADETTTGGTVAIGFVVDATRIQLTGN